MSPHDAPDRRQVATVGRGLRATLRPMSQTFDCTTEEGRAAGLEAAVAAVRDHEVVVLPTDTVYGVGADAFSPDAVRAVLDAKGRGADMPPPVLIPHARTADGLATSVPTYARDLMEHFWPGPLTLVLLAQPSLMWDLGDTNGTVALRVPQDEVALELLGQVGPMAVTSANLTGRPAALTAREALLMLGDSVSVYLDGGPCEADEPSTILDCTQDHPRILRDGALSREQIQEVLGDIRLYGAGELLDEGVAGGMPDDAQAVGYAEDVEDAEGVAHDDGDDGLEPSVAATEDADPAVVRERVGRHRAVPGDEVGDDAEELDLDEEDFGSLRDVHEEPQGVDERRDAPGLSMDPNL